MADLKSLGAHGWQIEREETCECDINVFLRGNYGSECHFERNYNLSLGYQVYSILYEVCIELIRRNIFIFWSSSYVCSCIWFYLFILINCCYFWKLHYINCFCQVFRVQFNDLTEASGKESGISIKNLADKLRQFLKQIKNSLWWYFINIRAII